MLHQLPRSEEDPPNKVKVELVVLDSGKVRGRLYIFLKMLMRLFFGDRVSVRIS